MLQVAWSTFSALGHLKILFKPTQLLCAKTLGNINTPYNTVEDSDHRPHLSLAAMPLGCQPTSHHFLSKTPLCPVTAEKRHVSTPAASQTIKIVLKQSIKLKDSV